MIHGSKSLSTYMFHGRSKWKNMSSRSPFRTGFGNGRYDVVHGYWRSLVVKNDKRSLLLHWSSKTVSSCNRRRSYIIIINMYCFRKQNTSRKTVEFRETLNKNYFDKLSHFCKLDDFWSTYLSYNRFTRYYSRLHSSTYLNTIQQVSVSKKLPLLLSFCTRE